MFPFNQNTIYTIALKKKNTIYTTALHAVLDYSSDGAVVLLQKVISELV